MTKNNPTGPNAQPGEGFYLKLLRGFAETGVIPDVEIHAGDALTCYLVETMLDPKIKEQINGNAIAARIFVDTMMKFVNLCLGKAGFEYQRAQSDFKEVASARAWSLEKRHAGWKALVQTLEGKYGNGLKMATAQIGIPALRDIKNDTQWEHVLDQMETAIQMELEQKKQDLIAERCEQQNRWMETNLKGGTDYARKHAISTESFCQTWALMGGQWNESDFERLHAMALLQNKYKELERITDLMGRVHDKEGKLRIGFSDGKSGKMEHASKSDITGISMGRDLGALLPLELAMLIDRETENMFMHKYMTNSLQVFGYQSQSVNQARSLHTQPARPLGPMIVCADMSGSMMGEPGRISLSLVMKLAEMCEQQGRNCYLIAFSVLAQPIEILRERSQLLRFFKTPVNGGTDARKMLDKTFQILHSHPTYIGADVLWISDFRIPMAPTSYLQQMNECRQSGTRFYGLKLGIAPNHWSSYFDEIREIQDVKMSVR